MKKLFIIKLLFVILVFQAQAANETVILNGITYTLGSGENTHWTSNIPINWGGINDWAVITSISNDLTEVSIPKSIVHNGTEYFVRSISVSGVSNLNKIELQDGVEIVFHSITTASSTIPPVKTIIIGKDVRIFHNGYGLITNMRNVSSIYCKDETPCQPASPVTSSYTTSSVFAFFGSLKDTKVYVPIGAEKTYKCTYGWSGYMNIIGSEECGYASNYGGEAIGVELINVQANYGDELVGIVNQETSVPIVVNSTSKIKSFTISVELPEKIVLTGELSNAIVPANESISIEATRNEDGIITINGIVNNETLEPGKNVLLNINVSTAWQNTYTVKLSNISLTTPNGETKSIPDSETKLVMQGVRGDMNGDGRVDLSDALYIINLATGLAE